jgi:hypothetical protein
MSLHNTIREVHEFEYRDYKVKIVERKMDRRKFLDFYLINPQGKDEGGMHYVFFSDIKEEDLADLSIAIPKIKLCLDDKIDTHLKWAEEKIQKKKEVNWTGQSFKRGDYVHFKGNDKYKPCDTYVWTHFGHMMLEFYLIQHHDGQDRSNWMAKPPFENMDGFECVHSSQLKEGLKYIQINCHEEFQGETDELILLERGRKIK